MKEFKVPSESITIKTEVACPGDTNPIGFLKGGRLVEWMDMTAASCAQIHSGKVCVTAAINHVDFSKEARTGDIIKIKARVSRVFNTSMEIYVEAFAHVVLMKRAHLISKAYFTFVALDENGRSTRIIELKPITAEEKKLFKEASYRRNSAKNNKTGDGRVCKACQKNSIGQYQVPEMK